MRASVSSYDRPCKSIFDTMEISLLNPRCRRAKNLNQPISKYIPKRDLSEIFHGSAIKMEPGGLIDNNGVDRLEF